MIKNISNDPIELAEALALVWRTFLEFEAPDYSEEGIQEFKEFIAPTNIREKIAEDNLIFWGFYEADDLAGMIAVRDNSHISLLFVAKEHHRKGIARKLYTTVIDHCLNTGCNTVTVNSSPYAVTAYQRLGFTVLDQEQSINGIRFIPMAHLLS